MRWPLWVVWLLASPNLGPHFPFPAATGFSVTSTLPTAGAETQAGWLLADGSGHPNNSATPTTSYSIPAELREALHPLSILRSTPARSGLRIAVLSGGTAKLFHRYAYQMASKPCYAHIQAYSFVADTGHALPAEERAGLPLHWVKVQMLRRWLPYFDWVFWLDLDATIFDPRVPVERFLAMQPHAHLVLPQEHMDRLVFSNDAFLLRRSAWGQAFLDRWWDRRRTHGNVHGEQGAMWMAIIDMLTRNRPLQGPDCSLMSTAPTARRQLYVCITDAFRNYTSPTGPVFFTPVDFPKGVSGLCLNGNKFSHSRYPAMQQRMPFCLHSKRPSEWAAPPLRRRVRWDHYQCPVTSRR